MDAQYKKVFVSYSWDSPIHQEWIRNFTNELRSNGVDANCDQFILQRHTKNLNQMMIEGIRDNDYVIYVLTENYKTKADDFQGGVGYEQLLSLPVIRQNPDKIILIKRSKGNFEDVLPFHLTDYSTFDFSNDDKFKDNLTRLVHRIYQVDFYEVVPLGPIPDLKPRSTEIIMQKVEQSPWLSNIEASIPKEFTDFDKNSFMKKSFNDICYKFNELMDHVKKQNQNLEYTFEEIDKNKVVIRLYSSGKFTTGLKISLGNWMGNFYDHIYLSYGPHFSISDQSFNEMISCEVGNDDKLHLKATLNLFSNDPIDNPEKIVLQIWNNHIKTFL